jgi:hypothetical protein
LTATALMHGFGCANRPPSAPPSSLDPSLHPRSASAWPRPRTLDPCASHAHAESRLSPLVWDHNVIREHSLESRRSEVTMPRHMNVLDEESRLAPFMLSPLAIQPEMINAWSNRMDADSWAPLLCIARAMPLAMKLDDRDRRTRDRHPLLRSPPHDAVNSSRSPSITLGGDIEVDQHALSLITTHLRPPYQRTTR